MIFLKSLIQPNYLDRSFAFCASKSSQLSLSSVTKTHGVYSQSFSVLVSNVSQGPLIASTLATNEAKKIRTRTDAHTELSPSSHLSFSSARGPTYLSIEKSSRHVKSHPLFNGTIGTIIYGSHDCHYPRCCSFHNVAYNSFAGRSAYWKARCSCRLYSSSKKVLEMSDDGSDMSTSYAFDRSVKMKQRNNAARSQRKFRHLMQSSAGQQQHDLSNDGSESDIFYYDYFHEEIAVRLVDRLDDMKRPEGFPLALDIGCGPGYIYRAICSDDFIVLDHDSDDEPAKGRGGIGGVRKLVQLDSCRELVHRDDDIEVKGGYRCDTYKLVLDDDFDTDPLSSTSSLPFPDGTFDLVISCGSLHWVNDLPSLFRNVLRVLKPDGCFLLGMVGGNTLPELRASIVLAELERKGGVGEHVGPFVGLSDVGSLLQKAGFALPTLDVDTITVSFPSAFVLMEHLQRMGENNASFNHLKDNPSGPIHRNTSKDTFLATACLYDHLFKLENGSTSHHSDSEVEATVQVIYAVGWKPHESQQKPLQRGTATHRFGDSVDEKSLNTK